MANFKQSPVSFDAPRSDANGSQVLRGSTDTFFHKIKKSGNIQIAKNRLEPKLSRNSHTHFSGNMAQEPELKELFATLYSPQYPLIDLAQLHQQAREL